MRRRLLVAALAAAVVLVQSGRANAYVPFGPRWPDARMPVPVCANPAGMPKDDSGHPLMSDADFGELVRRAFAEWQALPSSYVTVNYAGLCANDPLAHGDFSDTVGWAPLPDPEAAGYTWVLSLGGDIWEADTVISNGGVLNRYAGQMTYYRDTVLPVTILHEAGHFRGLDHSPAGCALMSKDRFNAQLCQDDIDGMASLYPGPQRATGLDITAVSCDAAGLPDLTFAWNNSPEVDGYWLDLTLDPFFATFNNYNLPRDVGPVVWPGVTPGLTHYWRLLNYNGTGAGYSPGPPFVSPRCYLGMPLPAEPTGLDVRASCAADGTATVSFSWNRVAAADGYWLDLTLDPMFGAYLNAPLPDQRSTRLTWAGLIPDTVHYWRVYAYNLFTGVHGYGIPFRTPAC